MATGAGWQQQYSPASGNPPSTTGLGNNPSSSTNLFYETGLNMEYTQDLHLKMSKKIAQLTKVSRWSLSIRGCCFVRARCRTTITIPVLVASLSIG